MSEEDTGVVAGQSVGDSLNRLGWLDPVAVATLTAERDALTQRVAELEAIASKHEAAERDRHPVNYHSLMASAEASVGKLTRERDAAIAEAGRLWQSLADVLGMLQSHGTLSALPKELRESAFDALAATTPPAASERREAEVRVLEAARRLADAHNARVRINEQPWDGSKEMGRVIQECTFEYEEAMGSLFLAVKRRSALDAAPGEVAEA